MRRGSLRLLLVLLGLVLTLDLYQWFAGRVLARFYGPSTREQIETAFVRVQARRYSCLVLGNSRMYRGLNPDRLPGSGFNFAHDQDGMNHAYYKLLFLQARGRLPERVLLGVDFFQFSQLNDERNWIYGPLLGEDFMQDYHPDGSLPFGFVKSREAELSTWWTVTFTDSFPRVCLATAAWLRGKAPARTPGTRSNGQMVYPQPGSARQSLLSSLSLARSSARLPLQVDYFDRTLALCRQHRVRVYLILPPTSRLELQKYPPSTHSEFVEFLRPRLNTQVRLLDLVSDPSFPLSDYVDATHLDEAAADRFSERVGQVLAAGESGLEPPRQDP